MNLEEMWARLAQHQPYADKHGYGTAWARMCAERTEDAALAARAAAGWAAGWAAAAKAAWAARAEAKAEAEADEAVRWIKRAEEEK